MKRYKVTDTITYERAWYLELDDDATEDDAIAMVDGLDAEAPAPMIETEIDNTPYMAEEVDDDEWNEVHAEI